MSRRRLVVGLVVTVAVAGAVFFYALPRLAGYGSVWREVALLPAWWIVGLLGVTALDILTYAPAWLVALPKLRLLDALKMTQASTAFSLVMPGGAALGMGVSFAMLRSAGFARGAVAAGVVVTGLWSQVSTFLFPVLAIVLLAAEGGGSATLRLLAVVGVSISFVLIAAGAAVLWREQVAARTGDVAARFVSRLLRLLGRAPVEWDGGSLARYRGEVLTLLRRRWISLTIATLANQLTGYLMLELSIRAFGIGRRQLSITETFAAWSIGRLFGSLPVTPSGLGVVELALTGSLVGFGAPHAPVVAAVLIYRALSLVPTIVLGLLATLTWRRREPNVAIRTTDGGGD
jgi:uncharacterized protein (TIRG00374 family)